MFAQHKLVRHHSALKVNINKGLLSWVLQHTQTSRVNAVWRQQRAALIFWLQNGDPSHFFLVNEVCEVASYLLSSCQLWSTSSVCSIGTDFSYLCLRCTVCWTWKNSESKSTHLSVQSWFEQFSSTSVTLHKSLTLTCIVCQTPPYFQ